MDIEKLKADPDYWDEVAPEGADEAYLLSDLSVVWYRSGRAEARHPNDGHWSPTINVWQRKSEKDRWIARPAWRGPEDGLPQVGTVCEYHGDSPAHLPFAQWRKGDRVEVIDHRRVALSLLPIVFNLRDETATACLPSVLRPLKSDKERAIDAAVAATILKDGPRIRAALSDIYDAGLLRLPEDSD